MERCNVQKAMLEKPCGAAKIASESRVVKVRCFLDRNRLLRYDAAQPGLKIQAMTCRYFLWRLLKAGGGRQRCWQSAPA